MTAELPSCYRCGKQPCECEDGVTLYHADCLDVMLLLEPVDACVTDCPYNLGFMGKKWDSQGIAFQASTWITVSNVMKPGAHLLAFGGTRTYHRLTCAIEDAGFEIRDCIFTWLYGQGFPKSLDVSKAIDKAAGVERERGPKRVSADGTVAHDSGGKRHEGWERPWRDNDDAVDRNTRISYPATDAAKLWDGWGTALKPACEPIVVAMKPLDGTFAQNALKHGVAGLNVDGGRIGTNHWIKQQGKTGRAFKTEKFMGHAGRGEPTGQDEYTECSEGRWPANVVFSHHPACVQVGVKKIKNLGGVPGNKRRDTSDPTFTSRKYVSQTHYFDPNSLETVEDWHCAVGCPGCGHVWPAAKLEPCPECKCERIEWVCAVKMLDEQSGVGQPTWRSSPKSQIGKAKFDGKYAGGQLYENHDDCYGGYADTGGASRFFYCVKASKADRGYLPAEDLPLFGESIPEFRNVHPTVKPVDLMRWLLTLVATPTGGVVLDPFAGSGTTGVAAKILGRRCVLIESEEEYCKIAVERLRQCNKTNLAQPFLFPMEDTK